MSVEILQDSGNEAVDSALPRLFAWVVGFEHSVVWLGAATGAGFLLIEASAFLAVGGRPTGLSWADIFVASSTYALYFTGIPITIAILVRGIARDARDLAPRLSAEEGRDASLYHEALTVAPAAVWLGVGVGLLVAIQFTWVLLGMASSMDSTIVWFIYIPLREITLNVAWFGVMGWAGGVALRLSQITQERARPDLARQALVRGARPQRDASRRRLARV